MKDVAKTSILVGVLLVIFLLVFIILGHLKHEVELLARTELSNNDPIVSILYKRVQNRTDLRRAYLVNTNLTSEDIIKFVLDHIEQEDYKKKTVTPTKITCQVTSTVDFTTNDENCLIAVIDNDTIMEYQKKYFHVENELTFDDIKYHGLYCKNSGKKYYCLIGDYQETVLGYSVLDKAYEEKNRVILYEYYLQVDLNDTERCILYFGQDYCANYKKEERPYLDEKTILEDGVLYGHVFQKDEETYYLEKSFIVAEN